MQHPWTAVSALLSFTTIPELGIIPCCLVGSIVNTVARIQQGGLCLFHVTNITSYNRNIFFKEIINNGKLKLKTTSKVFKMSKRKNVFF